MYAASCSGERWPRGSPGERWTSLAASRCLPSVFPGTICRGDGSPTESQRETVSRWHALTIRVHADWLMTPREDLGGQPPRHFLHRGRDWVDHELHNRQMQWSNEGRPPRPLDRDTFAYRYGPLGRHEVVMYFDLCREVIGAAWDRIVAAPEIDEDALTKVSARTCAVVVGGRFDRRRSHAAGGDHRT